MQASAQGELEGGRTLEQVLSPGRGQGESNPVILVSMLRIAFRDGPRYRTDAKAEVRHVLPGRPTLAR
jgi:hypothetical protein